MERLGWPGIIKSETAFFLATTELTGKRPKIDNCNLEIDVVVSAGFHIMDEPEGKIS